MMSLLVMFACVGILSAPGMSVPVYGTTRYGRPASAPAPAAPFYYRPARLYPYTDNYGDDLYYRPVPVFHYPYYPVSRPYSDDVYRGIHPYYYAPYGYYGNEETYEPVDDESSRTSGTRTDALPVGQETWFEGDSSPTWRSDYDDVNAAFLQNLIMSQMYDDAMDKSGESEEDVNKDIRRDNDEYDDRRNPEYYGERDTRDFEDEDVRELKALAGKPLYHVPKTNAFANTAANDPSRRAQTWHHEYSTPKSIRSNEDPHLSDDYQNDEGWINWGSKRSLKASKVDVVKKFTTMKPSSIVTSAVSSTQPPKVAAPAIVTGGQKEEVLLRPATPARHPFPEPVLHLMANSPNQNKRIPSVYDTIKRLLSMEEPFKPNVENKSRMQKRYIATEDDLVGELKGLKRRSTA